MLQTLTKIVLGCVLERRLKTNVQRATITQLTTARKTALGSGAARPSLIAVVYVLPEPLATSPISTSTVMADALGLLGRTRVAFVQVERLEWCQNLRVIAVVNAMGFTKKTTAIRVCCAPTRVHAIALVRGVGMPSWMTAGAALADTWSSHTTLLRIWIKIALEYATDTRS